MCTVWSELFFLKSITSVAHLFVRDLLRNNVGKGFLLHPLHRYFLLLLLLPLLHPPLCSCFQELVLAEDLINQIMIGRGSCIEGCL